ncbi:cell wall hydrolase [Stakelama saccharophila]|uniref:Cell wall hydrolase n=1 Tax=Stakelama saccharophila TaxID=3075605 RepID=A0ABZ0BAY7_9SPHN|nr:cell wall hydrolase [Stakelama sp. W311]WNO54554.1 cell wall hydrolase [Stakelama sp. W311]
MFARRHGRSRPHSIATLSTLALGGIFCAHGAIASFDQLGRPKPVWRTENMRLDAALPRAIDTTGGEDADAAASVMPARPFTPRGSALDRVRAAQCLTSALYYEAAREPEDGQRAIAQVILNRVRHPAFPDTVCGVVYQGSEQAGCQFSFACDGSVARRPDQRYWRRAARVADAALSGRVFAPVGLATHYHTYAVHPAWNRSLVMTGMFGAHLFHRWKGYRGTPAAFHERYVGGEPAPGPHFAPSAPIPAPAAATAQPVPQQEAEADAPAPIPRHERLADSGPPASPDPLPQSAILDKWKDSGKPLR